MSDIRKPVLSEEDVQRAIAEAQKAAREIEESRRLPECCCPWHWRIG